MSNHPHRSIARQIRRIAAEQSRAGYGVRITRWHAAPRSISCVISLRAGNQPQAETLGYECVGRVEQGSAPWIEITRGGVHIAGAGHSGPYIYPLSSLGVEQARRDALVGHVANQLRAASACPDSNAVARAAIAAAQSAL